MGVICPKPWVQYKRGRTGRHCIALRYTYNYNYVALHFISLHCTTYIRGKTFEPSLIGERHFIVMGRKDRTAIFFMNDLKLLGRIELLAPVNGRNIQINIAGVTLQAKKDILWVKSGFVGCSYL